MGRWNRHLAITIAFICSILIATAHAQGQASQPCPPAGEGLTQTTNTVNSTADTLTKTGTNLASDEKKFASIFHKPKTTTPAAATPAAGAPAAGAKAAAPCPAKPATAATAGGTKAATPAAATAFVKPGGYIGPVSWTYRTADDTNPTLIYTGPTGTATNATYLGYDSAGDYLTLQADASGLTHTLRVKNGTVTDIGSQVPADLTKTAYAAPHPTPAAPAASAAKPQTASAVSVVSGTPTFTLMPDGEYMVGYDAPDPPHKKAYSKVKKVSASEQAGHPNDGVYTDEKNFYVVTGGQMVITPANSAPH